MALIASIFMPAATFAQARGVPLSQLVPTLNQQVIAAEDVLFSRSDPNALKKNSLDTVLHINNLLAAQLSSFPLSSSAGGFTWRFEPVTGTFSRASGSFGPIFAERALTIGRKKLNVGVNYQHVSFDRLDGKALTGGELIGYTGLPFYLGSEARPDGLFFQEALDLHLTTDTVSGFATYGLSDRLDVGVAVPINHVNVKATIISKYGNTITGIGNPTRPGDEAACENYWIQWIQAASDLALYSSTVRPNGCGLQAEASGSATGIGDIVVRTKYLMLESHGGGVAAGVDLRLPTGDEENLLGIAGTQAKLFVVASTGLGRVSPHMNLGYTVSGATDTGDAGNLALIAPPDEINYAGGADLAVSLHTTIAFDVVGRTLRGIGTLKEQASFFGTRGGDSNGNRTAFQELRLAPNADLRLLLGSTGIKFNPFNNLLVTGNVLFPLSDRGLTDRLTWLLGFDYSY
jgi:hypothetical protein